MVDLNVYSNIATFSPSLHEPVKEDDSKKKENVSDPSGQPALPERVPDLPKARPVTKPAEHAKTEGHKDQVKANVTHETDHTAEKHEATAKERQADSYRAGDRANTLERLVTKDAGLRPGDPVAPKQDSQEAAFRNGSQGSQGRSAADVAHEAEGMLKGEGTKGEHETGGKLATATSPESTGPEHKDTKQGKLAEKLATGKFVKGSESGKGPDKPATKPASSHTQHPEVATHQPKLAPHSSVDKTVSPHDQFRMLAAGKGPEARPAQKPGVQSLSSPSHTAAMGASETSVAKALPVVVAKSGSTVSMAPQPKEPGIFNKLLKMFGLKSAPQAKTPQLAAHHPVPTGGNAPVPAKQIQGDPLVAAAQPKQAQPEPPQQPVRTLLASGADAGQVAIKDALLSNAALFTRMGNGGQSVHPGATSAMIKGAKDTFASIRKGEGADSRSGGVEKADNSSGNLYKVLALGSRRERGYA